MLPLLLGTTLMESRENGCDVGSASPPALQPAVQQPSLASLMHARLYAGGFDKKPRNVATTINAAKEGRGRTSHAISAIAFVGAATPDHVGTSWLYPSRIMSKLLTYELHELTLRSKGNTKLIFTQLLAVT